MSGVVLKSVTEFNRAMQRAQRAERPNPYWPCRHKRTPDNTKMKALEELGSDERERRRQR